MTKNDEKLEIEFPTMGLEGDVIKVVEAIGKYGGSLSKKGIQDHLKIPFGSLGAPISSAKRYNLITNEQGTKNLTLTSLGAKVYRAKTEDERKLYLTKAFLNVNEFRKLILEKTFVELPAWGILKKIFDDYGVPEKYSGRLANLFRSNYDLLSVDFNSLKSLANGNGEVTEENPKKDEREIPSSSDGNFVEGVRLGFKLAKMSQSKPSVQKLETFLQSLIDETSHFPQIKNMVSQVKDMVSEGYMPPEKAVEYISDKVSKMFGMKEENNHKRNSGESPNATGESKEE